MDLNAFDIHAHLNFPQFDTDREVVVARLRDEGIGVINVGTDCATSRDGVALAERHDHLWATVGVHPHDATAVIDWGELERLGQMPRVVGIGECGLDYFRLQDSATKKYQREIFERQIELALWVGKPLMLHIRDSYDDVLGVLAEAGNPPAHTHFFAAPWEVAAQFIARGITLSFTGVITFTDQYDEVIRRAPLDMIMAETDSPFVAPAPYRGQRNEPRHVTRVIERIIELRPEPEVVVRETLQKTARRVFGLIS